MTTESAFTWADVANSGGLPAMSAANFSVAAESLRGTAETPVLTSDTAMSGTASPAART